MGNWSCVGIYSLYNCDQNLPSNTNTAGGNSGTASVSLTTASNNSWVVACIEAEPAITMTTSGGTEDFNQQGASYQNGEGQHILKATAGSQTMSASLSYGARWNVSVLELKEYVASSAIKTVDGLAYASVKTVDGLAVASIKNIMGLA